MQSFLICSFCFLLDAAMLVKFWSLIRLNVLLWGRTVLDDEERPRSDFLPKEVKFCMILLAILRGLEARTLLRLDS